MTMDLGKTIVLPVYFWTDDGLMTAAVRWRNMNFGLSFPIEKNVARNNMSKTKLTRHLKEIVSVLVLHGEKCLGVDNQIDMALVLDQEAIRWKFDPKWFENVKAVDKLTKIKEITREQAVKLKLFK